MNNKVIGRNITIKDFFSDIKLLFLKQKKNKIE